MTQVMATVPACMAAQIPDAPTKLLARNPVDPNMKHGINTIVPQLRVRNLISDAAASYLHGCANGILLQHEKPEYRWLQHRWKHVHAQPEVKLSDTSNVDVIRKMKTIRCNWRVKG